MWKRDLWEGEQVITRVGKQYEGDRNQNTLYILCYCDKNHHSSSFYLFYF